MERTQIENLSRKKLQSLAKERGIKANAKSKVLVEKLVMWFEQNKENEVETKKSKTPKKKTKTPKKTKDLNSMTRKELQNLCKDNGIRANQKTSKLLEMLKNLYAANTKEKEEKSTVKKKTIDDAVEDEKKTIDDAVEDEKKTIDDEIIVQNNEEKIVKEKKRHSTLKSFDTSPTIQYGTRRRKSLKAKQLVSFNEIFDDAMNEEIQTESTKENTKRRRNIYVKALKCKPFKTKKSKRPTTAPKAFNLSTSNYGSHKKRNRNGEPLKPTWKMKTKPLPPYRGESLFSPKKPRKRRKNAFNLEESLAMPLTWVPKKGKIPSFRRRRK